MSGDSAFVKKIGNKERSWCLQCLKLVRPVIKEIYVLRPFFFFPSKYKEIRDPRRDETSLLASPMRMGLDFNLC